jgi:hypothetical protein
MNKAIFIDTSAWFAGIAQNDQYNKQAMSHRVRLLKENARCITSNSVVHETTMLLERKVSKKEAIRFLRTIVKDRNIEILRADEDIEQDAYALYQKYKDQDFSITDCISFSIMRRYRISRCFSFDHHFFTMGFALEPR